MADPTWADTTPAASSPNSQAADTPTWDSTESLEEKYGGAAGAAKAFAASAARTATFGASDYALTHTGIARPETLQKLKEVNPTADIAGIPAGIIGMMAVGPEALALNPVKAVARLGGSIAETASSALNPAVGKVLGQAGAMALGSVAESAFYTAGQAVSEDQLGDPDAFGEKLIANLGSNALISGALGSVFGAVKGRGAAKAAAQEAPGIVGDLPKTGVQPTDLQDLQDRVATAKANGSILELPQKAVLQDALSRVGLENPVHPLQLKSLEDQGARDFYNTFKEMQGKTGDALRGYETIQKNELVNKAEKAIADLSPSMKPTADATEGGNRAIKAFTDQYQAEKAEAGSLVNMAKSLSGEGFDHLSGVIKKWTDAIPEVSKMIDASSEGIQVRPYDTTMGITKQTYKAVREAVKSLKKDPQDFKDLFNIRKGLENDVNIFNADASTRGEIMRLKSSMMDYIQSLTDDSVPELRDGFKRYAVNEQERAVIEKAFGASVGSPEFGAISKIKPEVIGDRIFANTASVEAAKNILPKDKFNEVLANWLSEAKAASTDKGAFSSNKFGSFLRRNQDALNVAFKDNPEALQHLGDLTTIMRILPDAPPINPSGTAKTVVGMIKNLLPHNMTWEGMAAALPKKALEFMGEQRQMNALRDELAGKTSKVESLSLIERTAAKMGREISNAASKIFSDKALERLPIIVPQMKKEKHDNFQPKLSDLNADPQKMLDHLTTNTDVLHEAAPKTAQAAQGAMIRATQFLQAKLPGNNIPQAPLSPKYEPSSSEIAKWHKYFSAVENPTNALHEVAMGTIVPETMETLSTVYPKLLSEMQMAVTDKMTDAIAKKRAIPYRTKLSLSMFLGSDLVNSLDPKSMLATQNTLATATLAKQAQETQMGSANQKNVGKMKSSNRLLTASQKSAERLDG